ncbi:hypothetical protein CEXT_747981 [Caerostris extrusa]|uniref:Uncharacterized protein n=1 Tax=Caerostris extrusa TaxID=172846 RepID=A0AAV4T3L6_CAEEX|nr:hypothetical protein CEXT_747981 [Caerostris extrusa]
MSSGAQCPNHNSISSELHLLVIHVCQCLPNLLITRDTSTSWVTGGVVNCSSWKMLWTGCVLIINSTGLSEWVALSQSNGCREKILQPSCMHS